MSLRLLEQFIFSKRQGKIPQISFSSQSPLEQVAYQTVLARDQIINTMTASNKKQIISRKEAYIVTIKSKAIEPEIADLLITSMEHYAFQIHNSTTEADINQQKRLNMLIQKTVSNPHYHKMSIWNQIKPFLLLSLNYLELHVKFLIITKKIVPIQELNQLQKRIRDIASLFPIATYYCRKLLTIICHLKVFNLNANGNKNDRLIQILKSLIADCAVKPQLLTLDCRIILLFNCLKILLGGKQLTRHEQSIINEFYQAFGIKSSNIDKYEFHLLHIFFIIKGLIFRKGQALEKGDELQEEEEQIEQKRNLILVQKFANWVSINLQETYLSLEQVCRNIVRHRVASLATVLGMRLNLPQFCLNFLQLMHDGPFNNDAQTIKLCFQLFEAREYQKLHNSLQVLLSAASCKNLREREVLLAMCGIFTGLYLQNHEQALLYAKLNHSENKKLVLREQTLQQQVGFGYYNLAINEPYLCNRENYMTQALRCLQKSIEINPNNYLVQYCLAKIYLAQFNYELAYKHIMQSCKSGRGDWAPFSLLACIYYCQRRISKASLIVEQLIKKYSYAKLLYYIRAHLQANKILLQVDHDEQVEAAKQLSEQIYQLCYQKVLKSKSLVNLVKYCQEYHQISIGLVSTEFDQNYFNILISNPSQNLAESFREGMCYQEGNGQQALLQIIPLFLQVGQLTLSEGLLKILPNSPLRSFYCANLYELKKEKQLAIQEYRNILKQQPYHTQTLINLALIQQNPSQGLHQLDIAQKFVKNGKLWFSKGVLLSKLGRISEATTYLLSEGEKGWSDIQPDLLYYY